MPNERFIKRITPRNTEEIKPGLFIQTRYKWIPELDKDKKPILNEKGKQKMKKVISNFRQVHPAAWDGKINWYNFLLGHGFFKRTFFILLLLYLAWAYNHDLRGFENFYSSVCTNPEEFCKNVSTIDSFGNSNMDFKINLSQFTDNNYNSDKIT